jgi:hypothetical protein
MPSGQKAGISREDFMPGKDRATSQLCRTFLETRGGKGRKTRGKIPASEKGYFSITRGGDLEAGTIFL